MGHHETSPLPARTEDAHAPPVFFPEAVNETPLSPGELFSHHVVAARDGTIPSTELLRKSSATSHVAWRLSCGAVLGEGAYYIGAQTAVMNSLASGIWIGGAALVTGGAYKARRHIQRRAFERKNGVSVQDTTGHAYELYRTPKDDGTVQMHMDWHGATDSVEGCIPEFTDSVYEITAMAEYSGISAIAVDKRLLQSGMPDAKLPEGNPIPEREYLRQHGINPFMLTIKGEPRDIYSFSPAALRGYIEEQLGIGDFASLCHQLIDLNPHDPVGQLYTSLRKQGANEEQVRSAVKEAARHGLERDMIDHDSRIVLQTPQGKDYLRAESTATIKGDKVNYMRIVPTSRGNNIAEASQEDINTALGITPHLREAFREAPETLTVHQRKTLLQKDIYDAARRETHQVARTNTAIGGKVTNLPSANIGTQSALVESLYSWPLTGAAERDNIDGTRTLFSLRRRALVSAALLLLGGVTMSGLHEYVHGKPAEHSDVSDIGEQAAQETLLTRSFAFLGSGEDRITTAVSDALSRSLADKVPENWLDKYVPKDQRLSNDPGMGPLSSRSDGASAVGNLDPDSPNEISWRLTPKNGMSTTGYWGNSVHNIYYYGSWTTDSSSSSVVTLPTKVVDLSRPYTEVSRPIYDTRDVVELPVLQGSEPIAASIDGEPLTVRKATDGTYAAEIPDSQERGKLIYAVAPAKTIGPRAISHIDVIDSDKFTHTLPTATSWDVALPHRSANLQTRVRQEITYIQDHFEYALEPYKSGILKDNSLHTLTQTALLVTEKANCNVAASILAADNPQLNVATGWLNTNISNKPQVLSSHEAHAWTVDKKGEIYDATPSARIEKFASFFDESKLLEKQAKDQDSLQTSLYLYGGLALAGAAYAIRKRRDIARIHAKLRGQAHILATAVVSEAFLIPGSYELATALAARELPYMPAGDPDTLRQRFDARVEAQITQPRAQLRGKILNGAPVPIKSVSYHSKAIGLSLTTRTVTRSILLARRFIARPNKHQRQ